MEADSSRYQSQEYRPWKYQEFAVADAGYLNPLGHQPNIDLPPPYGGSNEDSDNSDITVPAPRIRIPQVPNGQQIHHFQPNHAMGGNDESFYPNPRAIQPATSSHPSSALAVLVRSYGRVASPSSSFGSLRANEDIFSQAIAFDNFTGVLPSHQARLVAPIAIPQTAPGRGQAFLRAYAPVLQSYALSPVDFVAFIDNLNVVSAASPPLQVLNLVGGVIGMVPHHWAAIAGVAIQFTAQLGTAAVSKGRTEMYLNEMNERFFEPRGLKASIASNDATRAILQMPPSAHVLAPLTSATMSMQILDRVLMTVRPFSTPLDLDVPPPTEQATILAKLSARQIELKAKKNQKSAIKDRQKDLEKKDKKSKKEHKRKNRDEKREKKYMKDVDENWIQDENGQSTSQSLPMSNENIEKHGSSKQSKEEKTAGKLLWIVIENL